MAYPDGWSLQSDRKSWSQQTGYRRTQSWHGPTATSADWLTEWESIYGFPLDYAFDDAIPGAGGATTATITLATDEAGDPLPPEDPDYGLIERIWSLVGVEQQLSIRENPRVEELAERWEPWPRMIRDWVYVYSEAQSGALKVWDDAGRTGVPVLTDWAVPIPPASITPTAGELANAETLAARLLKNIDATYETTGYQLRKVDRVTSWSTLVVSHTNVNRLLTWAKVLEDEPTVASAGLIQTAGLTGHLWLKGAPEVTPTSGGNYELTQTYTSLETPTPGSKREADMIFDYGEVIDATP